MALDGYTIVRELSASSRSHVYLAQYNVTGTLQVMKAPLVNLQADPVCLESF